MHDILLPRSKRIRIQNSWRYPGQAAAAARLPLIGRRVPMRSFWRQQPLRTALSAEHRMSGLHRLPTKVPELIERVPSRGSVAVSAPPGTLTARLSASAVPLPTREEILQHAMERGRHVTERARSMAFRRAGEQAPRQGLGRWSMLIGGIGIGIGALFMYLLDPGGGRRRRALARDKMAHLRHVAGRELPHRLERRGRFFRGVARGVTHDAAHRVGVGNGRHLVDDDETIVQRTRSEIFRDTSIKAGAVNIDAYEGAVTLRGEMASPEQIRRLIEAAKRVEGVQRVRSYLHTHDEPPPNMADVFEQAARELPAI